MSSVTVVLKTEIEVGTDNIPSVEFVSTGKKHPYVAAGNLVT